MKQKERITSNFSEIKFLVGLFNVAAPCIIFIQDKKPFFEGLMTCLLFWIISILVLILTRTRNVVYYDGNTFFIHRWNGQIIHTVPNEKIYAIYPFPVYVNSIGSCIYCVRHYDALDKGNVFYIIPRWRTSVPSIIKKLKEANPKLIT